MCGIVGIFSKKTIDKNLVDEMNSEILHRGPDSSGTYFEGKIGLAMRRLKVIDIESGDQPIYNEDQSKLVVFNGEIYNFFPLRDELLKLNHIFTTNSDTEVIIHGYEEWGIFGLLERLNGMFAFCIFDKKTQKAFFARDRLGEKPFYYYNTPEFFIFSSEMRALLKSKKIPFAISKSALYLYLAVHYVPGDQCIIEGIKKLLPGYYIELDVLTLDITINPYWGLKKKNLNIKKYPNALEKVRELMEESVRMRMISDVPLGLFLSGGIDSSILAGLMKKGTNRLDTFSIGFKDKGYDETEYSDLISKEYGTNHHHFIFDQDKVRELLPKVIASMDEPIGDQALLPLYWLSGEARKYVTVVLSGEGGDEIFGGYSYYSTTDEIISNVSMKERLFNYLQKCPIYVRTSNKKHQKNQQSKGYEKFINDGNNLTSSNFPLISDFYLRSSLIENFSLEDLISDSESVRWYPDFVKGMQNVHDPLQICQYSDIKTWLPDNLLMKLDKMSMAHSLEGRTPYLDHRLVELAFNFPPTWKIEDGIQKKILRDAFKDILPEKVYKRQKQGFIMPMSEWLKKDFRDILENIHISAIDDRLNNSVLQLVISEHISGKTERGRLIYSLMVYRLWCEHILKTYYPDRL